MRRSHGRVWLSAVLLACLLLGGCKEAEPPR